MAGWVRTLLYITAFAGGAFSVVGWVWWAVDLAGWVRRRRTRRNAGPLGTGRPPADPTEAGRYTPRTGGER